MTRGMAEGLRGLDPRLKLATALVLGPCLWKVHVISVVGCALILLLLVIPLAASQPVGGKMIRSLLGFIIFWVCLKSLVDGVTGVPVEHIAMDAGQLAARLAALLLLGLSLALSTSARALGLAVAWFVRPVVGRDRAWKVALSLALMVHFLPVCLSAMSQVRDVLDRRCPGAGFGLRARVVPQAVIRTLGQKTWSQTLAVASRRLEYPEAWEGDFAWNIRDWMCAGSFSVGIIVLFLI